jgi:hypothetical protein
MAAAEATAVRAAMAAKRHSHSPAALFPPRRHFPPVPRYQPAVLGLPPRTKAIMCAKILSPSPAVKHLCASGPASVGVVV